MCRVKRCKCMGIAVSWAAREALCVGETASPPSANIRTDINSVPRVGAAVLKIKHKLVEREFCP